MEAKRKIEIGKVYSAKVGGTYLPVRIDKSLGHGRYEGVTMPGGAKVKVATAAIKGDGETPEQWQANRTPKEEDQPVSPPTDQPKKEAKAKTTTTEKKERKPSGLDSAVRVLREAGAPMNAGDMVKTMLDKGYWSTGGKTPAATIYAAIITEIAKKGDQSRFRKTDRGMFDLTDAGKAAQ